MNKLSSRQIKAFDEIAADRRAAKLALEISIQYFMNMESEFEKRNAEVWDELFEQFNLNKDTEYTIKATDGFVQVVDRPDEE